MFVTIYIYYTVHSKQISLVGRQPTFII